MTKKLLILSLVLITSISFSQRKKSNYNNQSSQSSKSSNRTSNNATSQGSWLVEANTGTSQTGNTSFGLYSGKDNTDWSIGLDGGYFVIDRLAIKAGLGFSSIENSRDRFAYKIGAKYYIIDKIPVGLDFTGESITYKNSSVSDRANWIGIQGGYAWFVSKQIAIEPTLRYNFTTDDQKADSFFSANVGFALFF